jgi:hypothetical protein
MLMGASDRSAQNLFWKRRQEMVKREVTSKLNLIGISTVVLLLFLCLAPLAQATDFYVATNGDDADPGTLAQPFATIQKAADTVGAGDTVYIRGGSYHEVVNLSGVSGSAGNPITFTNYNGEIVTIDGTIGITSGWTQYSGNIYETTLSGDIWQLFVDDAHQTLARFPNVETWSMEMWDRVNSRRFEAAAGTNGHMVDDPAVGHVDSLAGAGVSFDDCVAVMNLRNWTTYARLVQSHSAGTDNFDYDNAPSYTTTRAAYFIEGGLGAAELVMLDTAKEWAFDEVTKILYLWADDGQNPAGRDIRGKDQDYFFVGDDTTSYITIDGLDFFATTVEFTSSDNITLQNCNLNYPSFSKRALGSIEGPTGTKFGGINNDYNANCTVYNCDFRYVDGPVIYYKKSDFMTIENNYFYMVDYGCLNEGFTLNGNNNNGPTYTRNTIEISGDSESCRFGIENPASNPATLTYNYHTRCGLLQTDGASVQYGPTSPTGSNNSFNWFIQNDRYSFRFDGDPGGEYGDVYRNVSISPEKTAFRIKGDYHEVYNNTAVETVGNLNIATEKGGNSHTVTQNNAADNITDWPIPGTESNNYNGQDAGTNLRTLLRDPDNLDFRPKAAATQLIDQGAVISGITDGYIGAAPDIGAFEYGDTNYSIGGRQWPAATHPVPPDGTATAKDDSDLMWRTALDATSYDVYFGTVSGSLGFQGNQSNNIFDPGTLTDGTTYYWRIDAVGPGGTVPGVEWSFTPNASSTTSITFNPSDDSYVEDTNPDTNYGSSTKIELRTSITGGITRNGYVKFNLTGITGTVTNATLRLYTSGSTVSGGLSIYGVSDTSWTEGAITWNNCPPIDGALLDSVGSIPADTWGEFNVTSHISGDGTYSLGLIRGDKDSNRRVRSKEDVFPPELVVTYSDSGGPTNNPPSFNSNTFDKSDAAEGVAYSDSIANDAYDPDSGDTLTFSKTLGPAWLSVAGDGTLSGTPGAGDVGLNEFLVRVTDDGGLFNEATMRITVIDTGGNNPPTFNTDPINEVDATEDSAYSSTLADDASDPESDPMTFLKVGGPAWLNVASNGALSGTPSNSDVGLNVFTVQVDATGGSDQATLNINVLNTNDDPSFTSDPIVEIAGTEDVAYSSTLADDATDPDVGDTLFFSLVTGPTWLSVASNGTLSGTPATGDVGLNSWTVQVDDDSAAYDQATLEITVDAAGGQLPGQASNPSPADRAKKIQNPTLSWTAGTDATSHDVYFGTDSTPDSGEFQGNQTGTTFDPGSLSGKTNYYWRIDEVNAQGTTTGTVWTFKTK